MTDELMTTRELAKYLSLNEKKIYALVRRGDIPRTRVTGKYLFPKRLIDRWIDDNTAGSGGHGSFEEIRITGSHDLAIDIAASETRERFPRLTVLSANVGSIQGISALRHGRTEIAGIHLFDPETKGYNFPYLEKHLPRLRPVVVHFLDRMQGLIVREGNPLRIKGFEDLTRPDLSFVNRQEGSGTRILLDFHLRMLGIRADAIRGYDRCLSTHTEVAREVLSGRADAGLGIRAAAGPGLDFIPVTKESYDLVIRKESFYTEPVQEFIEVVRSDSFRKRILEMGGYDLEGSGRVISWG